jgi:hypothetical protein
VLVNPLGRAHSPHGMADVLRAHLMELGLVRERPELFTSTASARTFGELDLGDLAPLHEAIPELSIGPRVGCGHAKRALSERS